MPVAFWNRTPKTWCGLPAPAVPAVALSGFAFSQAISSLQIAGRQVLLADDELRAVGYERDRLEIVQHVVLQRVHRPVEDMRAGDADAQRVAVGRSACDPADADAAARAADVLDHERLAERCSHALHQESRQRVNRPTRGKRHDQRDRTRWVGLRRGRARRSQKPDRTGGPVQKPTARKFHGVPSRPDDYSITSLASSKNDSGMVSPSAFAVVVLMTRLNFSGCSTGISAGFAPRRILST